MFYPLIKQHFVPININLDYDIEGSWVGAERFAFVSYRLYVYGKI